MLTINFIDEGNKYLLRNNLQCQAIAPVVYECIKNPHFNLSVTKQFQMKTRNKEEIQLVTHGH